MLPPGFRFDPTDEELVLHYLKRKVHSIPLPASAITELDVCMYDPWNLPGALDQEKYFFSKYSMENKTTVSGYWKESGVNEESVTSHENQVVGVKKTMVFYYGKPPYDSRTDWMMHEYRLSDGDSIVDATQQTKNSIQNNWVICRIFMKKNGSGSGEEAP